MNYNEGMLELFKELGLDCELEKIKEEEKASSYIEYENKIKLKSMDNEEMMFLSGIYLQHSNSKPKVKSTRKN
mgnify:CR=1 FL=1